MRAHRYKPIPRRYDHAQLVADLCSGHLIKVSVQLVATATVDRRGMMGDLLIAFARIGRPKLMETFEVVRMDEVSCGADLPL